MNNSFPPNLTDSKSPFHKHTVIPCSHSTDLHNPCVCRTPQERLQGRQQESRRPVISTGSLLGNIFLTDPSITFLFLQQSKSMVPRACSATLGKSDHCSPGNATITLRMHLKWASSAFAPSAG